MTQVIWRLAKISTTSLLFCLFYVIMASLMTLLIAQIIYDVMIGLLENNQLESTCKERPWPDLRYYSSIFLHKLRKTVYIYTGNMWRKFWRVKVQWACSWRRGIINYIQDNEYRGRVVRSAATCSQDFQFGSWSRNRIFWKIISWIFWVPPGNCWQNILKWAVIAYFHIFAKVTVQNNSPIDLQISWKQVVKKQEQIWHNT
jgi:hypothetical protein